MSSYFFSSHDQGPPSSAVHTSSGAVNCGDGKPWVCEHRHPLIAGMARWRLAAGDAAVTNWQTISADQIAFSRGAAFIVLNRNQGALLGACLCLYMTGGPPLAPSADVQPVVIFLIKRARLIPPNCRMAPATADHDAAPLAHL